jgi:hypothetical protein
MRKLGMSLALACAACAPQQQAAIPPSPTGCYYREHIPSPMGILMVMGQADRYVPAPCNVINANQPTLTISIAPANFVQPPSLPSPPSLPPLGGGGGGAWSMTGPGGAASGGSGGWSGAGPGWAGSGSGLLEPRSWAASTTGAQQFPSAFDDTNPIVAGVGRTLSSWLS